MRNEARHRRRHREVAREQLSLIARRKREITEAFYDNGVALTFLKSKDVIRALGRKSFAEVCEKDAGLSASTSERLVRIVAALTREQALAMVQTKATAMVNVAAATPEDDTAAGLFRKKSVALPGGRKGVAAGGERARDRVGGGGGAAGEGGEEERGRQARREFARCE
ncbi:hypothetical protein BH11MYX4_BH11MYX4_01330 [soil metagenome]